MSSPPLIPSPIAILGQRIHFDDFEISWAGENPLKGEFCFGSVDGRVRTLNNPQPSDVASPSGEAVNGIAFSSRAMAVSTRADVGFIVLDDKNHPHRAIYDGGAHGVIATSSGGFVAPLGRNGLLTMKPIRGPEQVLATSRVDVNNDRINFYKLARCIGDGKTDLVVGASRSDGLAIIELNSLEDRINPGHTHFLRTPGLDVVDVCPLNSPDRPRTVVWLGIDRSIHLSLDILEDRPSKSIRIKELQGKAYSILQDRGHLFLLTTEAVYIFPDLATRFLSGDFEAGLMPVLAHYTKVIDEISIAYNNLLLHIDGDIYSTPTEFIVPDSNRTGWASSLESNPEIAEVSWEKSVDREWSSKIKPAA
jgi:hypothetical protein